MTIADTAQGRLRGAVEGGVSVFRGVRYAQAPLGALRFRAAQAPESWQGVRAAAEFGPMSIQTPNAALDAMLGSSPQPQSEDCLYLNIWTPGVDDGARPVLVWIHGGGFTIGSGSDAVYDGAPLASRGDAVVVTINYRLGALGFLHLPSLGATNFGMRDQIAALRWVRRNIASFGGDPGNVTIFGESAGGVSVASLMASPEAAGLFQKAIPQSAGVGDMHSLETAEAVGRRFASLLGVDADDADGLRSAPAERILEAQTALEAEGAAGATGTIPQQPIRPIVDGSFLQEPPLAALAAGQAAGVSTLVGTMDEEWKLFSAMFPGDPLNEEDAVARAEQMHPDGRRAYDGYRAARTGRGESAAPQDIVDAMAGDQRWRIAALRMASSQARSNPQTYLYVFDWKSPAAGGALGSCHALDVPFTFGTHGLASQFAGSGPEADALAEAVMDAWLAFARSGDPSTEELSWPAWNDADQPVMVLGAETRSELGWRAPEVALWEGVI